ncbi:MAG: hypothetical protein JNK18_09680 [Cyclobacteriaceae bacterium]|nr:hypothetical protein [Cyclobacteriaceae bacterium]
MRIILVLVMAWSMLTSCKTTSVQQGVEAKDPVEGLVFLTFVMRSDSLSGKEIKLVNKTVVHQKMKTGQPDSHSPNRLRITQLNGSGKPLSSVAIDHPLFKRVEVANDAGQFQSKAVKLKDAEFFVRVTLFRDSEYILAEEELSGKITYSVKLKLRD